MRDTEPWRPSLQLERGMIGGRGGGGREAEGGENGERRREKQKEREGESGEGREGKAQFKGCDRDTCIMWLNNSIFIVFVSFSCQVTSSGMHPRKIKMQ